MLKVCRRLGQAIGPIQLLPTSQRTSKPFLPSWISSRVIIGAGAKVLGAITVGDGARIGANAVVVADVAPGTTVLGIPARVVGESAELPRFLAYGTPCGEVPDPVQRAIADLNERIAELTRRIEEGKK